jgi:mutator protein MutT
VRPGGSQQIPRPPLWRPGGDPPWAHAVDAPEVPLPPLLDAVRGRGAGRPPVATFDDARYAAVLIALYEGERGAEVVLTRRARHMRNHSGEVSFPGGRLDPGETPVQAALREAEEEVCLDPASVEVVGELDHLSTIVSRSHIVPIVGRLAERPALRAGTSEVDRILYVPLAELIRQDTYREEHWGTAEVERSVYFFFLDDETVWGATGRMLVQLLAIATGALTP